MNKELAVFYDENWIDASNHEFEIKIWLRSTGDVDRIYIKDLAIIDRPYNQHVCVYDAPVRTNIYAKDCTRLEYADLMKQLSILLEISIKCVTDKYIGYIDNIDNNYE